MNRRRIYVLDAGNRVVDAGPMLDPRALRRFAAFRGDPDRWIVAKTGNDEIEVSTVFLGVDHRLMGAGPPLVFETMVFRRGASDGCVRCSTWAQAEANHRDMVALVFGEAMKRKEPSP
jgi:hypothetical protein